MPDTPTPSCNRGRNALYSVTVLVVALATIGVLVLLQNISERKHEARQVSFTLVKVDERTVDPKEWGKNFPRQYDTYRRTVDIERTKHGGSEAFQKLDDDPRWRTIFAGYAFGIDYREERGHAYMLSDQRETERVTKRSQPGACLHCHSSATDAYRQTGIKAGVPDQPGFNWDAVNKGFELVNAMPYNEATKLVEHPVSCVDCHDPESMQLRVSRPGFVRGIQALARSSDPVPHLPSVERWRKGPRDREYDPNIDANRQEMRSFSCAQCHVEYYFRGEQKQLTFPWHKGLKMEQLESYYDDASYHNGGAYKDWAHAKSGAPVLKAQHPEFELWSQGVHARSGVACADCHMPYMREGAIKISDHHVRSPMLNIARSCQTCHRYPEEELKSRVEAIQDRTKSLMVRAEVAVVDLINGIESAKKAGATDEQLKSARDKQRKAQWRLDYIAAENSMGFHAPQESARILGEASDIARQGEIELLRAMPSLAAIIPAPTSADAKPAPAPATQPK